MIKKIVVLILFLFSLHCFSQKLVYKSNGTILSTENQKISPEQVRELLINNDKLLSDYNAGRSKKTAGNVLLIGGFSLIAADLILGMSTDKTTVSSGNYYSIHGVQSERNYPTALSYIGVVAVVVAIPIKIGFSKKIRNVVSEYNNLEKLGYSDSSYKKLDLITNSNGIGLRLTLN